MNGNGKAFGADAGNGGRLTMRGLSGVPAVGFEQVREARGHRVESFGDLAQVVFDRPETCGDVVQDIPSLAGFQWFPATQDSVQVARVPFEGEGKRFESAITAAP